MSKTLPPDTPPLTAAALIALIPKPDRTDKNFRLIGWAGLVGVGLVLLSVAIALGALLARRSGDLPNAGSTYVISIVHDLVRHGWEGLAMAVFLTGTVICLAVGIAFIVAMIVAFRRSGHLRIEKFDRDMKVEDEEVARLAAHPPERLAARSRRLKLEIQFYERIATRFGLATALCAGLPLLKPVIPPEWQSMSAYPGALAIGMGFAALVLHHRAEYLMRAEYMVSEAKELALEKAGAGGVPQAGR
jgi:hypothetical protein